MLSPYHREIGQRAMCVSVAAVAAPFHGADTGQVQRGRAANKSVIVVTSQFPLVGAAREANRRRIATHGRLVLLLLARIRLPLAGHVLHAQLQEDVFQRVEIVHPEQILRRFLGQKAPRSHHPNLHNKDTYVTRIT